MGVPAEQALSAAYARLKSAQFGLSDMRERPDRYVSGMMNAVTFGRMVTLSLQNMRGEVAGWEEWYAEKQTEMKVDPLMTYFIDLRNRIEKTTVTHGTVSTSLNLGGHSLAAIANPQPPGAHSFVIGSAEHGGASGWLVSGAAPDDEDEFYVVEIPKAMADPICHLPDAPGELANANAVDLVEMYLNRLEALLSEVRAAFLPTSS